MDLGHLFAVGVRELTPMLARRHLGCAFAERGSPWMVDDAGHQLERCLHRLSLAAADMLEEGFLSFDMCVMAHRSRGCSVRLRIGGSGRTVDARAMNSVLESLQLERPPGPRETIDEHRWTRAEGHCPATGNRVDFACLPPGGFVLSSLHALWHAKPALPPRPCRSRSLWIVDHDPVNAAAAARQAQRAGWSTTVLESPGEAERRLRRLSDLALMPVLLVAYASEDVPLPAVQRLRALLPPQVRCLYAVEAGAEALDTAIHRRSGSTPGAEAGDGTAAGSRGRDEGRSTIEIGCHPFSARQWETWMEALSACTPPLAGGPLPAPAVQAERPRVVVIDGHDVSPTMAQAMLASWDCDTRGATDGQTAIALCRRFAPTLVLVDIDMPSVEGVEATRQLRALQRDGAMTPCPILVLTDTPTADVVRRSIESGADACLSKPLSMEALKTMFQRWSQARTPQLAELAWVGRRAARTETRIGEPSRSLGIEQLP